MFAENVLWFHPESFKTEKLICEETDNRKNEGHA